MQTNLHPYTVLFVEDENETRHNYAQYFRSVFDKVYEAEDGEEGYALYQEKKPDIMIVDINLPKLNGIELLKKIRKYDLTCKAIILTAHESIELLKEAVSLKLTNYLVKPISRKNLKNSLDLLIDEISIDNHLDNPPNVTDMLDESILCTMSDTNGNITYVSKAYCKFTGYKKEELIGKNHSIFRDPSTSKKYFSNMWNHLLKDEVFVGKSKNRKKDGSFFWLKMTISSLYNKNGEKIGYSSYSENITEQKELEHISKHDNLTQLPNRHFFEELIEERLNHSHRYNDKFGFIILDIDHFKKVNDTYGHDAGDNVLVKLGSFLKSMMREDDVLARWGGEEFVLITKNGKVKNLIKIIEKIQNSLCNISFEPIEKITLSFGGALYKDGDTKESILKRADIALYKAKENGRNRFELNV